MQLIGQGVVRQVDLGHVVYQMGDEKRERIFCNNFGVGLEAVVTSNMNRGPNLLLQWLPGHVRYILAALQTVLSYQPSFLEVSWLSADGRIDGDCWQQPAIRWRVLFNTRCRCRA